MLGTTHVEIRGVLPVLGPSFHQSSHARLPLETLKLVARPAMLSGHPTLSPYATVEFRGREGGCLELSLGFIFIRCKETAVVPPEIPCVLACELKTLIPEPSAARHIFPPSTSFGTVRDTPKAVSR